MPSFLSWDQVRKEFPPDKFIVLLPQLEMRVEHSSPMWRLDITLVKINPDDPKLVYAVEKKWDPKVRDHVPTKLALQKPAIELLAAAADISCRPYRIDDRRDPLFREYEATALMTTPSGGVRGQAKTREWDGHLAEEKVRLAVETRIDRAIAEGWSKGRVGGRKDGERLSGQARLDAIETEFRTEWIREREFGPAKTESKAANRAIRSMLALPSSYTPEELRKTFVVPRWVFEPDMDDPVIKLEVVRHNLRARNLLTAGSFAGDPAPEIGPPQARAPEALPPGGPRDHLDENLRVVDASEVVGSSAADGTASPPPAIPEPPATFEEIVPKISILLVSFDEPEKEDLVQAYRHAVENRDYERLTAVWNAIHDLGA